MTNYNPIQCIKELSFVTKTGSSSSSLIGMDDNPEDVNISPNGQYIALNNRENIYLFDLKKPESGWQSGIEIEGVDFVVPTDSGGYWVAGSNTVQLINAKGDCELDFCFDSHKNLWGDDDWLFFHNGRDVIFAEINNHVFRTVRHKNVILHVWKHGKGLRFLSVSDNKKHL